MTSKHIPAPKTHAEIDTMDGVSVAELLATLSTYPPEHIVFAIPNGTGARFDGTGAELIVAPDGDTDGVVAYGVSRTNGEWLTDYQDQEPTQ